MLIQSIIHSSIKDAVDTHYKHPVSVLSSKRSASRSLYPAFCLIADNNNNNMAVCTEMDHEQLEQVGHNTAWSVEARIVYVGYTAVLRAQHGSMCQAI